LPLKRHSSSPEFARCEHWKTKTHLLVSFVALANRSYTTVLHNAAKLEQIYGCIKKGDFLHPASPAEWKWGQFGGSTWGSTFRHQAMLPADGQLLVMIWSPLSSCSARSRLWSALWWGWAGCFPCDDNN
jgi:hypothetical protein